MMKRLLLFFAAVHAFAQPRNLAWSHQMPIHAAAVAVDSAGNIWIGGSGGSGVLGTDDLPVSAASAQQSPRGGYCGMGVVFCRDGVLMKTDASGRVLYATYFGGEGDDYIAGLALGPDDSVYITGMGSPGLPLRNAHHTAGRAFAAKFAADGTLIWSTFLAESVQLSAAAIAVDTAGRVFVAGVGSGAELPSANAFQPFPVSAPLYRSADGGRTWQPQYSAPHGLLITVDVNDPRVLYGTRTVGRYEREVLRSGDAGRTWAVTGGRVTGEICSALRARGDSLWISCMGRTYRSGDAGRTFAADPALGSYFTVAPIAPVPRSSTVYAGTSNAVLRSDDDGATWRVVREGQVIDVAATATSVFVLADTRLFVSADGGSSWAERTWPGGWLFASSVTGAIYSTDGHVSSDGGITWQALAALPERANLAAAGDELYATAWPSQDVWVARLDADGALQYATWYGGAGDEVVTRLVIDPLGRPVVSGDTASRDLPLRLPVQSEFAGGERDAFAAVFSADLRRLDFASWLGTPETDVAAGLAVGGSDVLVSVVSRPRDVFRLDDTHSTVFRITPGAPSPQRVIDLPMTAAADLKAAPDGTLWLSGRTARQGLATENAFQRGYGGGSDGLLMQLSADGETLMATYFGGENDDVLGAVAVTHNALVVLGGGNSFPVSHPPFEGDGESWVMRFASAPLPAPTLPPHSAVNGATFSQSAVAPGSIVSIFGEDLARGTAHALDRPLPTEILGTTVTIAGIPAPLFYVSPQQVNAQVPYSVAPGSARVQVRRDGALSVEQTLEITPVSPFVWSHIRNANGNDVHFYTPARPGHRIILAATGLGALREPLDDGTVSRGPNPTVSPVQVTIAGVPAVVEYAGAYPNFAGLYQLNVVVPDIVPPPEGVPVVVTSAGRDSNTIYLRYAE